MTHPRTPTLIAAIIAASLLLQNVARSEDAPKPKPEGDATMHLAGKVESKRIEIDGAKQTRYVIEVGATRYLLQPAEGEEAALKKLAGKHVELSRPAQDPPRGWMSPVQLDAATRVRIQKPVTTQGTVGVIAEGTRKQRYSLETDEHVWATSASDGWKFKKHVGHRVAATAFRATNGKAHVLLGVKKVVREPNASALSQGQAMAGAWRGAMIVTTVPPGAPGVRKGTFDINFNADEKLKAVKGRLFGTYEIVGLEMKSFHAKQRTAEFDVLYTFGQGNFRAEMTGIFSKDWKQFTGDWTSKFVGLGTFELKIKRGK